MPVIFFREKFSAINQVYVVAVFSFDGEQFSVKPVNDDFNNFMLEFFVSDILLPHGAA